MFWGCIINTKHPFDFFESKIEKCEKMIREIKKGIAKTIKCSKNTNILLRSK